MNYFAGLLQYLPEKIYSLARISPKDVVFKSTKSKTFEYEDTLPDLPVPSLRHTLDSYLESVRAVATDDEYKHTESVVKNFENGVGERLQKMLLKRAEKSKNWLEQWWEDVAYLQQRLPLIPYSNMTASHPTFDYWPVERGTRNERTALILHSHMQFWKLLRKEQLKPIVNKGSPWSMYQYRRIFNVCRVPGETKDTLISNFKTEAEGWSPTNVVVLYRGYIFSFDLLVDDQPLTPAEIESQLRYIENWCDRRPTPGPGIGALTTTDRSRWARNRQHLMAMSANNAAAIETIEKALMVLAYDDGEPVTQLDILIEAILNNCEDRWADKSLTEIAYRNGNFAANADHTPFDGLAIGNEFQYMFLCLDELKGVYNDRTQRKRNLLPPTALQFDTDEHILSEISAAKLSYRVACDDVEILYDVFADYGRSTTAVHRLHPEAYIQVALQLAYYRTHGRPAATYCTATARKFYHGRTETCRACFAESVEFAKAVLAGDTSPSELYSMLQKACQKFQQLMTKATNGYGCDRHLFGLYLTAAESGIATPELFTDPSYTRSGGAGSFTLSTSCTGYWNICGSVTPMVANGYSFFYGIEKNEYAFTVSSFRSCAETSAQTLADNMRTTLLELRDILNAKQ